MSSHQPPPMATASAPTTAAAPPDPDTTSTDNALQYPQKPALGHPPPDPGLPLTNHMDDNLVAASGLNRLFQLAHAALHDAGLTLAASLQQDPGLAGSLGDVNTGVAALHKTLSFHMWHRFFAVAHLFSSTRRATLPDARHVDMQHSPRDIDRDDSANEMRALAQLNAEMEQLAVRKERAGARLAQFAAVEKTATAQLEQFRDLRAPLDAAGQLSSQMAAGGQGGAAATHMAHFWRDYQQMMDALEQLDDDAIKPLLASVKKERRRNSLSRSAARKTRIAMDEVDPNSLQVDVLRNLRIFD